MSEAEYVLLAKTCHLPGSALDGTCDLHQSQLGQAAVFWSFYLCFLRKRSLSDVSSTCVVS